MIALLLGAALVQAAPLADPCAAICDAHRLRPYFDKLARIRAEGRFVHILQIGDSHTAGDQITGAWRAALQTRYGNAGRGVLAAGRPYQGYLTRDVTASQSPDWLVSGIFGGSYRGSAAPPIGLSGYSLSSTSDGAWLSIKADRATFDTFQVCALTGPGAGVLTLSFGGIVRLVPLAAERPGTQCERIDAATPAAVASLSAGGTVTVTSWATGRITPGVVLSNVGTVGAQLVHLARADDRVVAAEARAYRPDLLVVAFGTNEAFMPRFAAADHAARLRAAIARLKRLFPDVPMLMLGAPDSATSQPGLQFGESGASPACPAETGIADPRGWRPTAALAVVQATQRRIARAEGLAFWDWGRAMGGRCAAQAWVRAGLMRADRVHFSSAGGAEVARLLQQDLDAAAVAVSAR